MACCPRVLADWSCLIVFQTVAGRVERSRVDTIFSTSQPCLSEGLCELVCSLSEVGFGFHKVGVGRELGRVESWVPLAVW